MATARPEVIKADTGRAELVFNSGTNTYDVIYNGNRYVTLADQEPVLIDSKPDALDDLGLKEARQKMDAAHNEMIRTKYNLAVWKETPGLFENENKPAQSPFTEIRERSSKPQPVRPTPDAIQVAIDAPSIKDPEYREAAKEFLDEVLPLVREENERLFSALAFEERELREVVRKHKAKVAAARKKLEDFNKDIYNEYQKFEAANKEIKTLENHYVTTRNCRNLVGYSVQRKVESHLLLEAIREKIDKLEATEARDRDPEHIKQLARNNAVQNTKVERDGSGIGKKIAAVFRI